MSHKSDASTHEHPAAIPLPLQLIHLLDDDDLDGAIEAGLMEYRPDPAHDRLDPARPDLCASLSTAQQKLQDAWAARDRYHARQQRLARLTSEREARRATPPSTGRTPLPPTVADILARAKAKAAGRSTK